ncbi:hypothetical protein LSTR_LSTR006068 [Laodelphax striatellus]|uniref:Uncharacterized protein n=1 Tax=Laodelphax striatellus TaxID=195883 RepID=A0A482XQ78_LAOST|nr:hypothetical protein LSTR_LSTR006068 [Laodelphax striatellus]
MDISILVHLIIFKSVGVLASLHSWGMTSRLQSYHRDFYYSFSLKNGKIYGSEVSPNYPDEILLRVGEQWVRRIGVSGHEVICKRLSEKDFYNFHHYAPKLHVYSDKNDESRVKTLLSYFTFSEREVWNCQSQEPRGAMKRALRSMGKKLESSEPISFYRIVNVMHGIRPINVIFYFDGVEVYEDVSPVKPENDMGDKWTATFREVKYLDPSDNTVLKYNGKVFLSKEDTVIPPPPSIFEPIDVPVVQPYDGNYKIEVIEFLENGNSKIEKIGPEGETLIVGKKTYLTIGLQNDEAVCKLLAESKSGAAAYSKLLPEFNGKEAILETFSVNRQEIWNCTYNEDKNFIRRLTELVVSIPVEKIEYYSGISVWKYRLSRIFNSVKIREIYYYEDRKSDQQIKFNGVVKLIKPKEKKYSETELEKYNYYYPNEYDMPIIVDDGYDSDDDLLDGAAVIAA